MVISWNDIEDWVMDFSWEWKGDFTVSSYQLAVNKRKEKKYLNIQYPARNVQSSSEEVGRVVSFEAPVQWVGVFGGLRPAGGERIGVRKN